MGTTRVTGKSITDAQIAELRGSAAAMAASRHITALCDLATGSTEEARTVIALRPGRQSKARRECARLYEAMKKTSLAEIFRRLADHGVTPEQAAQGVASAREACARNGG